MTDDLHTLKRLDYLEDVLGWSDRYVMDGKVTFTFDDVTRTMTLTWWDMDEEDYKELRDA